MKRAIFVIIILAVIIGGGLWFYHEHNASSATTPPAAADTPPPDEGTKVTHDEKGNAVISMSDDDQGDAGIAFSNPSVGEWQPEIKGYGRVLDPAPLAALVNELVSAQGTATASSREWERQKTLDAETNTSERVLQTAEAAAQHDQLAIQSARDRLVLTWGATLTGRRDLTALVQALTARQAALVRVDLPAGDPLPARPEGARLVTLSGQSALAKFVSAAPDVDPQLQGEGFIFLVQPNTNALAPGQAVTAWLQIPGDPQTGVIIPREAVVRSEGAGWVYVMNKNKGGEAFTRTKIPLDKPAEKGWFINGTVKTDDYIVVTGAQTLLSEELKAALSPD